MDFLKNIGQTVNDAVDFVVEKNKKFTKITRLKRLIKKESDSIIRSYITLGKHYYKELKDVPDKEMQKVCSNIDASKLEIKKLKKRLIEVNTEQDYSKFRDLVEEDEPVDIELYINDDKNICDCDDISKENKVCDCDEKSEVVEVCDCEEKPKVQRKPEKKSSEKKDK